MPPHANCWSHTRTRWPFRSRPRRPSTLLSTCLRPVHCIQPRSPPLWFAATGLATVVYRVSSSPKLVHHLRNWLTRIRSARNLNKLFQTFYYSQLLFESNICKFVRGKFRKFAAEVISANSKCWKYKTAKSFRVEVFVVGSFRKLTRRNVGEFRSGKVHNLNVFENAWRKVYKVSESFRRNNLGEF